MLGQFITIEGIEGSGKTTLLSYLQQRFINYPLVVTREPGGTKLGEEIRNLLLTPRQSPLISDAELLLVFAARAAHLAEVIIPSLNARKLVICDRFTDATYAYQGGGRGIAEQRIAILESLVQNELRPNITLLLDLPVEIGLARAKQRAILDRFEQETLAFHQRVRDAYLVQAQSHPHRFYIIDASRPIAEINAIAEQIILNLLHNNSN